jgi:hypothetical protein
MNLWLKHPRSGKPDAMLTLAVFSTLTVLFKFLLNGVSLTLGAKVINFGVVDAGLIAAILTPTLGAYVTRKMKDSPDPGAK